MNKNEILTYINKGRKCKFKKVPFYINKNEYTKKEINELLKGGSKSNKTVEFWLFRGYSIEESKNIISDIQSNLGKRQEKGKARKDKNKLPQCKEYYIENGYTEEESIDKAEEYSRKRSTRCKEYYIEKGHNENEALELLKKKQDNSKNIDYKNIVQSTQIEYYINKGFSKEESKKLLKERQTTFSLEKCIEKYGKEEGTKIFYKRQEKWHKTLYSNFTQDELEKAKKETRIKNGNQIPDEELKNYIVYKRLCWKYTNKSIKEFKIENFDKRGINYHLDHKYSIMQGFKDGIIPSLIGSFKNLEILPAIDNCSKKDKCSIPIEDLFS